MTMVSVLIPTYNRAQSAKNAVLSALGQRYEDLEVIVVDDGSTDDTENVIRNIKDPRIQFYKHETNAGEPEARNTAVRLATGRYVAFLDSDDEWLPEKLSKQIEMLQHEGKSITANVTGYILIDEFGVARPEIPNEPKSWYKHLLLGCGLAPGATLVVSRSAYDKVGLYDTSFPRHADWDWLLRYVEFYPLTVTKEPLAVVYRSSVPAAKVVEEANNLFVEKHLRDFYRFGRYYGGKAIAKRWLEVAVYFAGEKDIARTRRYLLKALLMNPLQRPGMYLRIMDGLLGTSVTPWALRQRQRWMKR